MSKSIIYFLLFSNFCVLVLYGLRWANLAMTEKSIAMLDGIQLEWFDLYWDTMPKALLIFLAAFIYLWTELMALQRTQKMENILDADDHQK